MFIPQGFAAGTGRPLLWKRASTSAVQQFKERKEVREMLKVAFVLLFSMTAMAAQSHPILPIGSAAPEFALPGTDGEIHRLGDYASSPILVVVFTCNHCPIAQMYEQRIEHLAGDYKGRGVALVAIQPNDPKAIRIDELDSSDVSDGLDEMKIRVRYKHLTYPYLYDGDTQQVARAYGPQATPHVFIFDEQRKLRYEGRIDDSYRIELVKTHDARNAIEALLAHKAIPVTHTGVMGCSTKWSEKAADRIATLQKIEAQPVTVELVSKDDLAKLRTNPSHQMMLVDFWATWCGSCIAEFADLQDTLRMYSDRDLSLVTVSVNMPDEEPGVLRFLQKKHATSRNLLFSSTDTVELQQAFDPTWDSAVPYTILLSGDGKVLYKQMGSVDLLELRRTILANVESEYAGFNQYWKNN
jgi:peroxiredoxin